MCDPALQHSDPQGWNVTNAVRISSQWRRWPKWAACICQYRHDLKSGIFICYLITPEALKDKVDSPWACSFSAPDLLPYCAMMPNDSFQPVQLKGEIMDLEFTIDTDHR